MTVRAILKRKLVGVISAAEDDDFLTLSDKLTQHNIGAVVVLSDSGRLVGIVSERDLVRAYSRRRGDIGGLTAADMMTKTVHTCSPEATEIQVMTDMLNRRIRHMPVVENDRVIGVVSLADSARHRMIKTNVLFEELEKEPDEERRLGMFTKHLMRRSRSPKH